ncbi:MAG TPA: mechanosensitive ion channel family protein [Actinomycetota bacterium]
MRGGPIWTVEFDIGQLIAPLLYVVIGMGVGWAVNKLVVERLKRNVTLTKWRADDVVIGAVHDVIVVWFAIAGVYAAERTLPLRQDVAGTIEHLLLAAVIVSGTLVAAKLASDFVKLTVMRTGSVRGSSSLLVNIARVAVFVIGLLILLQALGVAITPLLTALGVGGLALALALQPTLAALFAGINLLASKKIQPGDYVELDTGDAGYVVDIDWRNTTLRQLPNNFVIIPNTKMAEAIVTNFYRPEQQLAVLVEAGVAYDSDLGRVEEVTIEVAREVLREVAGGVADFDPFIRYHTFNDSSIDFTVILRGSEVTDKFLLKHEFIKRLHRRYEAEGITIPFPLRTVILQDGSPRDGASASRAGRLSDV